MSELIITNGDSAAELLGAAGIAARTVPWRDVLHEGPLVPTASLELLSDIRASFLSQRFALPYGDVRADFVVRDAVASAHALFDRVAVWVEHDLYDQLQLLQILDFFHREGRSDGLTLVQADDFLAAQQPAALLRFAEKSVPVTPAMAQTAAGLWQALLQPTPEALMRQLRNTAAAFPFMRRALGRFLEELPAPRSGLGRSERVMLSVIGQQGADARTAFGRLMATEEAAFMGDWSAFRILDDLASAPEPLIAGFAGPYPVRGDEPAIDRYLGSPLSLTRFGRAVMAGEADTIAVNGIDRWWAGTHMTGHDAWRWDSSSRRLTAPGGAGIDETGEQP